MLVGDGARELVDVGCRRVRVDVLLLLQGVSAFIGEEHGARTPRLPLVFESSEVTLTPR